ncbi:PREDICTED: DNA-directed RNA polymerase I subunit RPA12 isoform X2 [Diuraphis noxia]|uniref:DNA-directed RNA polymerase I subunit RPA12 isoform X2 n=1 Tax=Diuraphis noxia TaxID=143948 RepID=UPI0007635688|nr:PREDICTED: DNA-directed RNA polymerase I subunit RPA12 isoform X2 [Diuraphis noxia]
MNLRNDIETYPGFCSKCGSILPSLSMEEFIKCYSCKTVFGPENDGPIAERRCSKCGHNQMSYAAVQLRSADEGQTVFYTCLKCKFTESENS